MLRELVGLSYALTVAVKLADEARWNVTIYHDNDVHTKSEYSHVAGLQITDDSDRSPKPSENLYLRSLHDYHHM